MAGKEGSSERNKDDDDELNALLDSALNDFEKLPKSSSKSAAKETTPNPVEDIQQNEKNKNEPSFDNLGLSESDIEAAAAEFEASMKNILGDDDELLRQWNAFAGNAASFNSDPTNGGNESFPKNAEAFEAHLLKTMKNMAESASTDDVDENFLKAMADMGVDGQNPNFNQGIFPMMQGMMMNLLSKDVLYPALDELRTKYPAWLDEKKSKLASDVYENYSRQYQLVCEICSEYEKENDKDIDEVKKKRFDKLMVLMQKMQRHGQPPHELVGDRVPGQEAFGENFGPDKCPVM